MRNSELHSVTHTCIVEPLCDNALFVFSNIQTRSHIRPLEVLTQFPFLVCGEVCKKTGSLTEEFSVCWLMPSAPMSRCIFRFHPCCGEQDGQKKFERLVPVYPIPPGLVCVSPRAGTQSSPA